MFKRLYNWWNADKIKMAELTAKLDEIAKQYHELEEVKNEKEAEAAALQEQIVDHSTSLEPWVEIKSERIDPIKGLVIELDWNDAFVQYLKDNGIDGRDDETIVQKWIAMLYKDMMTGLENQVIEKSDRPRVNDFE